MARTFTSLLALPAVLFALFTPALSTPLSTCHPNFQGNAMAIINNSTGTKWGLAASNTNPIGPGSSVLSLPEDRQAEFRFDFSGRASGSYLIRAIHFQGQNLVVTNSGASTLDLSSETSTNDAEYWFLDCTTCGTDPTNPPGGLFASGCTIKPESAAPNTVCVEASTVGAPMGLGACNGGSTEVFEFWSAA